MDCVAPLRKGGRRNPSVTSSKFLVAKGDFRPTTADPFERITTARLVSHGAANTSTGALHGPSGDGAHDMYVGGDPPRGSLHAPPLGVDPLVHAVQGGPSLWPYYEITVDRHVHQYTSINIDHERMSVYVARDIYVRACNV